jgi:sugar transferase (PEP-CTERM/EpsH1 system associated)
MRWLSAVIGTIETERLPLIRKGTEEMNILYVTPYVPSHIRSRPYNLIRALIRLGHRVTLLTAAGSSDEEQRQADELRGWGVQVEVFPVPLWRSLGNCLRALPTREPLQAVYAYHPGMKHKLAQLLREETFDVVHIEHLRAARLVRTVNGVPKVYDSVDSISLLFDQAAQASSQLHSRLMTALDLARTRRYEALLLTQYDQVVISSRRDKLAMDELARRYLQPDEQRAPITVVTNGVDLEYFRPQSDTGQRDCRTVVFTGKISYHANVAALLYFAREVLPRIWATDPAVRFQIVGKDPPEIVQQLTADRRIQVTGYVDDLRPYLAQATVAVCPVRYAVGVQFKVLEAMAMGTPVVTTPQTSTALLARKDEHLLVGERADDFAAKVIRLLNDRELVARIGAAGRRYVEEHHDWNHLADRLEQVYRQAIDSC